MFLIFYNIYWCLSMKKLLIFIFSFILLIQSFSVVCFATDETDVKVTTDGVYDIDPPDYEAEIALLVNADTDTVIYGKNADEITAPASLTKIVTALVVLSKNDSFDTEITCSREAIDSLLGTGSSVVGLLADEIVPLEMLMYCLMLPSANDAAVVLAEHYGNGDVQAFVDEMNEYCKSIGCENTFFANPHGLDDESIEGFNGTTQNQTTANDMYLIAKEAIKNDVLMEISKKYGKTMPPTNKYNEERYLYNTNALLNDCNPHYYEFAEGLKTGTTDKAGSCLVTTAENNGYTYIAIAMKGGRSYFENGQAMNTAFTTCRYMLQWAFDNVELKTIADNTYNVGEIAVEFGRGNDHVALVPSSDVNAVVHSDITIDDMKVVFSDDFPSKIPAPVKKGDVVGTAYIMYGDILISEVTLVAQDDVEKNHLWAMFNWIQKLANSKTFLLMVVVVIVVVIIFVLFINNNRKKRKRKNNRVTIIKDYSKLAK